MLSRDAKKLKVGDTVVEIADHRPMKIEKIEYDQNGRDIFFTCQKDGDMTGRPSIYHHRAIRLPLSPDEEVELYIKDRNTRVRIRYNDELGEWRYAVEVEDSNGFWLDSFKTKEEAEEYIKDKKLKTVE